jgi:hypothetical protein
MSSGYADSAGEAPTTTCAALRSATFIRSLLRGMAWYWKYPPTTDLSHFTLSLVRAPLKGPLVPLPNASGARLYRRPRKGRGQDGSPLLSRVTLSFTTSRRFIPTQSSLPGQKSCTMPTPGRSPAARRKPWPHLVLNCMNTYRYLSWKDNQILSASNPPRL